MKAREVDATSSYWKDDIQKIKPFIDESISDSGQLDNAIELLVRSGRTLAHSQEMLIPSAWENNPRFTKKQKAFYQYHSFLTEPWDGPAAIVASDGRDIIAGLDRSGLRPMRWMVSDRYVLAASEVGICPSVEAGAYKTAQLEPGQTIRYRIENDELLDESQVITKLSEKNPYIEWVNSKPLEVDQTFNEEKDNAIDVESLSDFYEYTPEEERLILLPMLKGDIPTGSMGNDTSLAVMSKNSPRLSRYFHQLFAQVTNPPIDPIRERFVMSTKTYLGKRGSILKETAQQANLISLDSPILSGASFDSLTENKSLKNKTIVISTTFIKENKTLEEALDDICEKVKSEILENNKSVIIFSDRGIKPGESVVPSLMVIGKVHHYLIDAGIRLKASLISVSGEIRDSHDVACHISYGASAVWPYLALEKVRELSIQNETLNISIEQAQENYRKSLNKGLLKIMSKMGICTISSYRGSELFEIIGLNSEIINNVFKFSKTRTEGYGFEHFNKNLRIYQQEERAEILNGIGGFYKHKKDAETHVTSPKTVLKLQKAVRSGELSDWHSYLETLEDRDDVQLRDLFSLPETTNNNVVLEDDSLKDLYKKFTVSSMSLGALSEEAHQALAIAINQIGGKSGSGEGGEDPARFDNEKNSKIKQIASGRFGVTPDYLASAEEFQIKMAQSRRLTSEIMKGLRSKQSTIIQYPVSNEDRSIGARVSGEVSINKLGEVLKDNPTHISLSGAAGQSFGAFIRDGINLKLIGSANDYVGKGMGGGSITIIPQGTKNKGAYHAAGNAILYGATGGQLYISGRVGQRFGVRNSGGIAVVEGCSAHAAEYMTGGTLIILGSVGFNFGAGMTGGKVIVLKTQKNFSQYISKSAPESREMNDIDLLELRAFLNKHIEQTGSELAKDILKKEKDWSKMFTVFGGIANVTESDIDTAKAKIEALD